MMASAGSRGFGKRAALRAAVDLFRRVETVEQTIAEHVAAVLAAEREQLERECQEALKLTRSAYWHQLTVVYQEVPLGAPRVPPTVACAWPAGW